MPLSQKIGVVDYGTGNLRSVVKAFEYLGAQVLVFQSPAGMDEMDALVFPGQGTFDQCLEALDRSGLDQKLREWVHAGKPYFGICLGLQVLFEGSEEGKLPGLKIFPGTVRRFPSNPSLKVPHMGWNAVNWNLQPTHPLRKNLVDGDQFYFVHSYYVTGVSSELVKFETSYGIPFVSGIFSGKCVATQFHPEKSQSKGLQLYRNFLEKIV